MTRVIIVMGVSGCGKTVVGKHIANYLDCQFIDSDDLHPPKNVERMRSGIPLDDETRKPWLDAIVKTANEFCDDGGSVVIACSALKSIYRDQIRTVSHPIQFIYLHGDRSVILERMQSRKDHYMPPSLLDSQFEALEDPTDEADVVAVSIAGSLGEVFELAQTATDSMGAG